MNNNFDRDAKYFFENWLAVSSIGVYEHFQDGAKEKRLKVFGTSAVGGDFIVWDPQWQPYNIKIVRPSW